MSLSVAEAEISLAGAVSDLLDLAEWLWASLISLAMHRIKGPQYGKKFFIRIFLAWIVSQSEKKVFENSAILHVPLK